MTRLPTALALRAFLGQVAQLPLLSPAQQAALADEAAAGDSLALRALAQSHLPWVLAEAAQRRGRGLRFDRLLACGNVALLRALRQDPHDTASMAFQVQVALDEALHGAKPRARGV
jgi:RNA polymerase primary sigma factor